MPKRKRSSDSEVGAKLDEYEQELARALKVAKGFERQRLSKRVHLERAQDKIQRLEREITTLKALDLHQTAHAHLASSLTKFKSIAEHPALPDNFKQPPPKADISEEEKTALHNVTSGLYNRPNVREVVEKAIRAVCLALELPIPDKKAKRKKGQSAEDAEPSETIAAAAESASTKKRRLEDDAPVDDENDDSGESFNGFSDDEHDEGTDGDEEDNSSVDEGDEEGAISKYESMLGGSDSDDDSEGESREDLRAKYAALLGMSGDPASGDDSDEEDDLDLTGGALEDEEASDDEDIEASTKPKQKPAPAARQPSLSPSPPPTRKTKEKPAKAGSTTFLPSLMGGYMSGSESASDVDVAPKKRLGQRQRQAIAERKHGENAKHVRKQAEKQKKGRDAGWDMRRGAVDGDDQGGKGRQPWKKGGSGRDGPRDKQGKPAPERKKPQTSRDDQGPLHPSWEARKKAKETAQISFQGTKIKF
ncbi:NADH-ubiquinone oxidoreductase 30.4 kDa subunit [Plectosphaerella plurivora]|uniref:NADH-ubiquinone oxidoreductase 30.4 kDa subunit n=1 Tax=Plectosphaerella plurivora TaxID=936078 RepID=A0A9P9A8M1_9PEZI|nr:NADH-ubiquinone oxidoreductase 30.4 kDa subunit [Plectosphaerella plurivora]